MAGSELTRDEVMEEIREEREETHGFVTDEGAAGVVAARHGVMIDFWGNKK